MGLGDRDTICTSSSSSISASDSSSSESSFRFFAPPAGALLFETAVVAVLDFDLGADLVVAGFVNPLEAAADGFAATFAFGSSFLGFLMAAGEDMPGEKAKGSSGALVFLGRLTPEVMMDRTC